MARCDVILDGQQHQQKQQQKQHHQQCRELAVPLAVPCFGPSPDELRRMSVEPRRSGLCLSRSLSEGPLGRRFSCGSTSRSAAPQFMRRSSLGSLTPRERLAALGGPPERRITCTSSASTQSLGPLQNSPATASKAQPSTATGAVVPLRTPRRTGTARQAVDATRSAASLTRTPQMQARPRTPAPSVSSSSMRTPRARPVSVPASCIRTPQTPGASLQAAGLRTPRTTATVCAKTPQTPKSGQTGATTESRLKQPKVIERRRPTTAGCLAQTEQSCSDVCRPAVRHKAACSGRWR